MNQAQQTIAAKLVEMFAEFDADVLESSKKWAVGRAAALREFKASDEYQAIRRDAFKLYARLHDIAGGKTWYAVFNGNSDAGIEAFMVKNCAATVEKRNAMIANKLVKAGVNEVISEEYVRMQDGFNGTYVVMTDSGKKVVTIQTIIAGGWNIQCRHLRVLVKVK